MAIYDLRSRDVPPPVAPREGRAEDLGADRALVSTSSWRCPIDSRRRPRAVAGRGRRAERGRGPGGCQAVRRDDLPDRRPGSRGRLSELHPRHRAEAQAASRTRSAIATSIPPSAASCRPTAIRVFNRALENRRALYREANIPRETRLAELEQQYQKTMGAMTVTLPGPGADPGPDGPVPGGDRPQPSARTAWELSAEPSARRTKTLSTTSSTPCWSSRIEIAHEAGFASYVDFAFRQRERFDYGVDDAVNVPRRRREGRRAAGAEDPGASTVRRWESPSLRPWDTAVDPLGRPPLKPFGDVDAARRGNRDDLPRDRSGARGPVRLHAQHRVCSTWPTARARRPAAIRPRSRTIACRSSS